ncbi:hypothetical protein B0H17DRAFT_1149410 [Mycena rosella]|uniref:Uncharacterized protein n=1 Tax=Mycena rosella TaxID=1033263 RepID=A0AAD7C319_MYCRO|nr:hypothetical protein B0H17DRAFT_1149410 [Mycena rosella]
MDGDDEDPMPNDDELDQLLDNDDPESEEESDDEDTDQSDEDSDFEGQLEEEMEEEDCGLRRPYVPTPRNSQSRISRSGKWRRRGPSALDIGTTVVKFHSGTANISVIRTSVDSSTISTVYHTHQSLRSGGPDAGGLCRPGSIGRPTQMHRSVELLVT